MAWTTPQTFASAEVVTASKLNLNVRDNLRYLKGLDGPIELEDRVSIATTNFPPLLATRSTGVTNSAVGAARILALSTSASISDGFGVQLSLAIGDSAANGSVATISAIREGSDTQAAMIFATNSSNTERMRISQAGNVGIGEAAPLGRFHVKDGAGAMLFYGGGGSAAFRSFSPLVVLVPSGSQAPIAGSHVFGMRSVWNNNSTRVAGTFTLFGNAAADVTADLFNNGSGEQLIMRMKANGQLEIERIAGTFTYMVSLMLFYINA
jgi:hypothetical protein